MKTKKSKKPIAKCFDYEDGRTTQVAYVNAYNFGDRLLEGVMVKCVLDDKGYLEVSFTEDAEPYMCQLNEKYWLGAALDFAIKNDIFCDNESGSGDELCFVEIE